MGGSVCLKIGQDGVLVSIKGCPWWLWNEETDVPTIVIYFQDHPT